MNYFRTCSDRYFVSQRMCDSGSNFDLAPCSLPLIFQRLFVLRQYCCGAKVISILAMRGRRPTSCLLSSGDFPDQGLLPSGWSSMSNLAFGRFRLTLDSNSYMWFLPLTSYLPAVDSWCMVYGLFFHSIYWQHCSATLTPWRLKQALPCFSLWKSLE